MIHSNTCRSSRGVGWIGDTSNEIEVFPIRSRPWVSLCHRGPNLSLKSWTPFRPIYILYFLVLLDCQSIEAKWHTRSTTPLLIAVHVCILLYRDNCLKCVFAAYITWYHATRPLPCSLLAFFSYHFLLILWMCWFLKFSMREIVHLQAGQVLFIYLSLIRRGSSMC